MSENKSGRPAKATPEEKKLIFTRYCIDIGAASLEAVSSHGVFRRLADYAHKIGFHALQDYDFANDKAFRAFMDDYITSEKQRKASRSQGVGAAYVPLNIPHFFTEDKTEQFNILQEREKYFSDLYEKAAVAIENYENMDKTCTAMKVEKDDFKRQVDDLTQERDELKDFVSAYKQKLQEITKENVYYKKRLSQSVAEQVSVGGASNVTVIKADTTFSSLISADQRVQKSTNEASEIEDLLNNIKTIIRRPKK